MATDSTTTRDSALETAVPPQALGTAPSGLETTGPDTAGPLRPETAGATAKPARPARAQLHFAVIVLLCVDVVFGLGLAVFAEKVIDFEPMAFLGLGLAVLGLGILAYFVLFGDARPKARP